MIRLGLRIMAQILLKYWLKSLRVSFSQKLPSNVIYGLWHQDLPSCMAAFQNQSITVMISASRDGAWAAELAQSLGYKVVRGSSSRKQSSLRHLCDALRGGGSVGMALDGPKGPPLQAKPGAAWLASQSARPLVMLSTRAFPAVRVKSWDRTVVPLPFARVHISWESN